MDEQLRDAAEEGNLDVIEGLIEKGVNVNEASEDAEETALHMAAMSGHVEIVDFLIQNGANVNAQNADHWTPLHFASNSYEISALLIRKGANVNTVEQNNRTALYFAVEEGNMSVVRLFIQNGADPNTLDQEEETVLARAAASASRSKFVLELLCLGAKITKKSLECDKTGLLAPIEERLSLLRNQESATDLYSKEEKRFVYNLGLGLALRLGRGSFSLKTFSCVLSLISFHDIFMAPGFACGKMSLWNKGSGFVFQH